MRSFIYYYAIYLYKNYGELIMKTIFNNTIETLLIIGVCAYLCQTLAISKNSSSGISKALGLVTSLCVFLCIISPFSTGFKSLNKSINYNQSTVNQDFDKNAYFELITKDLEKQIKDKIIDKFGILVHTVSIDLSVAEKEISISQVLISTDSSGINEKTDIEKYVCELLGNVRVDVYENTSN